MPLQRPAVSSKLPHTRYTHQVAMVRAALVSSSSVWSPQGANRSYLRAMRRGAAVEPD